MNKILITGAGTGIGHDAALALAERGHHVIATARSLKKLSHLQRVAQKSNVKMEFVVIDVRNEEHLQKISKIQPDVLINNAAIGESGPVSEIPMDRIRNSFETNIIGVVRGSQIAASYMLKNNSGRIIIIGSIAGNMVVPFNGAYHMTKHALEALTDGLRQELEPRGIFVTNIEPGKIDTGFNQRMAATKHEWLGKKSAFRDLIPAFKASDKTFWEGGASTAPVVKTIIKAVESKHPRPRYVTPTYNFYVIPLRRILPDRLFDWGLRKFMNL